MSSLQRTIQHSLSNMKTIIIYDQVYEEPISFYIVDGDKSHLDKVYGNHTGFSEKLQDELFALVFNEDWTHKEALAQFPIEEALNGAKVIVCGFLP